MEKFVVTKKVKLRLPILPNFLFDEQGNQYSVKQMTEEEIHELGKEWTKALIERNRNNKNK